MLYNGEIKPNWNTLFKQNNNKILIIKDKTKRRTQKNNIRKTYIYFIKRNKYHHCGKSIQIKSLDTDPINMKSMSILNDIEMNSSSSKQSIIIKDDYNKNIEIKLRSIMVTVIKMKEEESESTDAFDVFQNIEIKKTDLNADIS